MNRADRKLWASARTLDDLCELTAMWLEGALKKTPGHDSPPMPETAEITAELIAANRAGFLTWDSQPGRPWDDWENGGSCQYAAVTGFIYAGRLDALRDAMDIPGATLVIEHLAPKRTRRGHATTVTVDCGEDFTSYGQQVSRRDLAWEFGICHPDAIATVCDAWQVTIAEMEPGRNDRLWPALAAFAAADAAVAS